MNIFTGISEANLIGKQNTHVGNISIPYEIFSHIISFIDDYRIEALLGLTCKSLFLQTNWEELKLKYYEELYHISECKKDGSHIQYVKNQTERICLVAVRQNRYALQYVKNQTEQICLEAVKQNGYALYYVKNQTEQLCLEAVRQNRYVLQYVKKSD